MKLLECDLFRAIIALCCLASTAAAQIFPYPQPVNPRQFALMAWGNSPSDPAQLQLMKQAGFNVSGFCPVEDLEKVRAAGLTCIVVDPRANGYEFTHVPPDAVLDRNAAELSRTINGNPAALAFMLADEPAATMLAGLGAVAGALKRHMPSIWPYVTAFPYPAASTISPMTYDDYLRAQVRQIGQPYISYDHYALYNNEIFDSFFTNLDIVRRISLEMKVPFWNCILANAHENYSEPTEASLSVQAYSTLAYGGRGIEYFTYITPDNSNYRNAAIDRFGNRTPTWEMLRRVNGEIQGLVPLMLHLHSTGVYRYPTAPGAGEPLAISRLIASVAIAGFARAPAVPKLVFGEFVDDQNLSWLMVVNRELAASAPIQIVLKDKTKSLSRISPYSGKPIPTSQGVEWIAPGAGVLFAVK
jgi:hypothetical protein